MTLKPPPQNLEAEKSVLGFCLKDQESLSTALYRLSDDDFNSNIHKVIFNNIKVIFEQGKLVSTTTLTDLLKANKNLDEIGGLSYLYELTEKAHSKIEFKSDLDILEDKRIKRGVITAAQSIVNEAYADSRDAPDILKSGFEQLWKTSPINSTGVDIISSGRIYDERKKGLSKKDNKSIFSYYKSIDELLVRGFQTKEISVLAGRPGQGKSSVKSNLIKNQLEEGICVVNFAPEQTFEVEQARIEALETQVPLGEILTAHQWKKGDYRIKLIREANQKIDDKYNYHIIPTRKIETSDVRTVLYRIGQTQNIDIIYIDLFDKLSDVAVVNNKAQTVASKLNVMNQIAEEFDCHVCLLVQISREVEKRSDKRPRISDIKDAGAYEEAARLIMMLYREKYYNPDSLNSSIEFIVGKNSNGPTDTIEMDFDLNTLSLDEKETGLGGLA